MSAVSSSDSSFILLPSSLLRDGFGRVHDHLRISVTDRCNLRCVYCMPEDVTYLDKNELLSFEEIERFVRAAVPLGLTKLRLTGGEPLLRRDMPRLVRMLAVVPGVRDIGLTTNGLLLADHAAALYDAGLRRINVSLDTLDDGRFRTMARRDGLAKTLDGIDAALKAGFAPVKVNAVVVRGLNEMDVVPLARKARADGWEMRFIEYMPIGAEPWERGKVVFAHEMLDAIEAEVGELRPAEGYDPHSPAMEFEYAEGGGRVGMIASVSRPFCRSCNRVRLTCDGKLRACLFALEETDVKALLRGPDEPAGLAAAVRSCVAGKWEGHEINTSRFLKPLRTMHAIGG
ncbi:MAG: GTP 3',8-cyclase MoaA [Gemmataceae bacterium]